MEKSTIYRIDCVASATIYIGMTVNYSARRHYHLYQLHAGLHPARLLQADFDAFGEDRLRFTPIREVPRKEARKQELLEMWRLATEGHRLYNPEVQPKERHVWRAATRLSSEPISFDGPDEALTVPQAAALLGVGRGMVYHLFKQTENPLAYTVVDDKGTRRVPKSAIAAFLNAAPRFYGNCGTRGAPL